MAYQIDGDDDQNRMQVKCSSEGQTGDLGMRSKGQISFNLNCKVNFKEFFLPNFVCVLTNERHKTYQTGFSFCHLGHAPGVELWGAGGAQGVKKNSNMVMWLIKSTGMKSRTECK